MKYTLSIDNLCLFITAVAKDRLAVFRTDAMKLIICAAIDEGDSLYKQRAIPRLRTWLRDFSTILRFTSFHLRFLP